MKLPGRRKQRHSLGSAARYAELLEVAVDGASEQKKEEEEQEEEAAEEGDWESDGDAGWGSMVAERAALAPQEGERERGRGGKA